MIDKEVKPEGVKTEDNKDRRDFIKTAAATAIGLAIAPVLVGEAKAQMQMMKRARVKRSAVKLNQGAVLPDGKRYTRAQLLGKLGLDPKTPPEAWITITCGTHAGALKPEDAKRLLDQGKINKNMLTPRQLNQIRRFRVK